MRFGLEMQKFRTPHDIGGGFSYVIDAIVQRIHVMKRRSRIESWCTPLFKAQDDKVKRENPGSSLW